MDLNASPPIVVFMEARLRSAVGRGSGSEEIASGAVVVLGYADKRPSREAVEGLVASSATARTAELLGSALEGWGALPYQCRPTRSSTSIHGHDFHQISWTAWIHRPLDLDAASASMNDIFDAWSREFVLEAEAGGHPASKIPSVHGFIGRTPKEKLFDEIPAARRSLFAAYEKLALFAASEPSADSKTPPPGRSFL